MHPNEFAVRASVVQMVRNCLYTGKAHSVLLEPWDWHTRGTSALSGGPHLRSASAYRLSLPTKMGAM